jgi:purine-binding chemotaxis protein CheW
MPSLADSPDARPHMALVCRVRSRFCALPVADVEETMRPLPIDLRFGSSAPPFVLGVATVRGVPTPVVDAAALIGAADEADAAPTRFVVLRVGERRVALAVEGVVGLRLLPAAALHPLPPLLNEANTDAVAAIASLDAALLLVLRGGRMLPDAVGAATTAGAP